MATDSFEMNFKKAGDVLEAQDVRENFAYSTVHALINCYNLDQASALTITPDNYKSLSSTDIIAGSSTACTSNVQVYAQDTYDDYALGSVNLDKWTTTTTTNGAGTASVTVSANTYIRCHAAGGGGSTSGNGTATALGSGLVYNLDFEGSDEAIKFYLKIVISESVQASGIGRLYISDGSTDVQIINKGASWSGYVELVFNNTNDSVDVYVDGTLDSNDVDLSSLAGKKFLKIYATANGGGSTGTSGHASCNTYLYQHGKMGLGSTYTATFTNQTISGSTFIGMGTYLNSSPNSSTIDFSLDGGATFVTGSPEKAILGSISGGNVQGFTELKHRLNMVNPTSIDVTTENVPDISNFIYFYG